MESARSNRTMANKAKLSSNVDTSSTSLSTTINKKKLTNATTSTVSVTQTQQQLTCQLKKAKATEAEVLRAEREMRCHPQTELLNQENADFIVFTNNQTSEEQLMVDVQTSLVHNDRTENEISQLQQKKKKNRSKKSGSESQSISVESLSEMPSASICRACCKEVYIMEEIRAEKSIYHKNCFRCNECNKHLNVDNYTSHEGVLYCTVHHKLLFAPVKCIDGEEVLPQVKHELIIRESQPVELPPDVARASDKPNLGLEDLQQVNIRSRFKMFEEASTRATGTTIDKLELTSSRHSDNPKIMAKLAKLQAHGLTAVGPDEPQTVQAKDVCLSYQSGSCEDVENDEFVANAGLDGDGDYIVRSKKIAREQHRERPIGLGTAMDEIKTIFEQGHADIKEERREERKQELQNIRSRLFMGKQARIKEMYQQAVTDSEQVVTSSTRKDSIEITTEARSIKDRFESGEMFNQHQTKTDGDESFCKGTDAAVFESAISKESRIIFKEIDANLIASSNCVPRALKYMPPSPAVKKNNCIANSVLNDLSSSSDKQEPSANYCYSNGKSEEADVQIETNELSKKFQFFETYRPSDCIRKEFRITPPREGVIQLPHDTEDVAVSDGNINTDTNVRLSQADKARHLIEKSQTTSRMLNKFREIEQNPVRFALRSADSSRQLKNFTPPPDGYHQNTDSSGDEETEDKDEEDDDESNGDDGPCQWKNALNADVSLQEAKALARAKQLRVKFEKWEPAEIAREASQIDIYSAQVSDDTTIDSTKT